MNHRLLALIAAVLVAALFPAAAHAFAKYAKAEEKPCSYCHISPAGGGSRNYRGVFYQQNGLSFADFDDVAEAKKAGVEIGPAAAPPPKSLAAKTAADTTPPPEPASPPVDLAAVRDFEPVTLDGIEFIKIPAGTFRRGTTDAQRAALEAAGLWTSQDAVEQPAREIRITKPFLLAKYETTQAQWRKVMAGAGPPGKPGAKMQGKGAANKADPSSFKGDDRPVETVSWNEVQEFLSQLTKRSGGAARYRLPTEAEWEYACRAGSSNTFGMGADKTPITVQTLPDYAWLSGNANNETHPVGQRKPNAWGLYDMHGNVWEWCQDGFSPRFYATSPAADPVYTGPATERVLRGGSWFLEARSLRCAVRGGNLPEFKSQYAGFRIVREL